MDDFQALGIGDHGIKLTCDVKVLKHITQAGIRLVSEWIKPGQNCERSFKAVVLNWSSFRTHHHP